MATHQAGGQPDPGFIFNEMQLFQRSMALKGAVELDIFTHIGNSATSARELAARCGAAERGVRILCDYLTICGHLSKTEEGYELTPTSRTFLSKASPAYIGSMAGFLVSGFQVAAFRDVAGAVRNGGAVKSEALDPENPIWVEFARSMAPMMAMVGAAAAPRLMPASAGPMKILDIAAGHGMYGIAMARHNSQAEITGQDWRNVLEVAKENAEKAGVAARYRTLPGNAFEVDFGGPYDLALVPNFAHHFNAAEATRLFRKCRAALKKGGRLALVEFIPDEDRVSPPEQAAFALTMLVGTPAGDAYTFAEYQQMLQEAGFRNCQLLSLDRVPQRVVIGEA
ncbi:MAG TPA: class I SAM-dependent methyltransferase [Bryobacteraceae bacterium]|nr:class I SAM-dependent methyltransferase [Bryobacteraceae bacterium]